MIEIDLSICRLCSGIKPNENLISTKDPNHSIELKVARCCPNLNLSNDETFYNLPTVSCTECLDSLNDCVKFIDKVWTSQQSLKQALGEKKILIIDNASVDLLPSTIQDDDDEIEIQGELQDDVDMAMNDSSKSDEVYEIVEVIGVDEESSGSVEMLVDDEAMTIPSIQESHKNVDGTITAQGQIVLNLNRTWSNYPWTCAECQQMFNSASDLRSHFLQCHNTAIRYSCADCSQQFLKYLGFLSHVRRVHHNNLRYCCDICSQYFWNLNLMKKHYANHTQENIVKNVLSCSICSKNFRSKSTLNNHQKSHHAPRTRTHEPNRYNCDVCEKTFAWKPNLLMHQKIHTGERDFVCNECGKTFVQKGNLENHMLTHVTVKPFSCPLCPKSFKTLIRLNLHSTLHTGIKPFRCEQCGKEFREKNTLREHSRIHSGAMPFACEYCEKKFRFKGVLTTHIRSKHTGIRPYSCVSCDHHFSNWPNYNKHMQRRHGINTSTNVRKPQKIPPSGMPPQTKLNHVVPTPDNNLADG